MLALLVEEIEADQRPGLNPSRQRAVGMLSYAMEATQIAALVGAPDAKVQQFLDSPRLLSAGRILELHGSGYTVSEISRAAHLSRKTVYDKLADLGLSPNRKVKPVRPGLRPKIVELRNKGLDYGEIRKATGATTSQIRNALRDAAKSGRVPDYGKRHGA